MPEITLYELEPTRSARARWALLEAGLDYQSVNKGVELIGSDELKQVHPLGKLPAIVIDGEALFESAAIVTAIADLVPEKQLLAGVGTRERNLHYQWSFYALTELEAWAWSTALNTFVLPEAQRVTAQLEQNKLLYRRSAQVLDAVLSNSDYLVGEKFSATDIVVSFALNFGNNQGFVDDMPAIKAYLERMQQREHCCLNQPLPG